MKDNLKAVRFVEVGQAKIKYLRQEDIIDLLEDLAGSAETDTRNRIRQYIFNLINAKPIS